jgi:catechol 2,3-dioxygenase-like lactoylglutathione lyase family enzyme
MSTPRLRFLSLFVDDLQRARQRYAAIFGVEPLADEQVDAAVPRPHPFSPAPPVVFDLGGVALALYQIDGRITHMGDVGIGVVTDEPSAELARRVQQEHGQVMQRPGEPLLVFALPDRHFFEVVPG